MRKRSLALVAIFLAFTVHVHAIGPTTKANDDSCDIALLPAATLLVPYFEVDFLDPANQTTLFSITNVTNVERIARVTLWTDFAYPVATFNIHLTGYDVQSISLYDVIANGVIAGGGDDCGPGVIPTPLVTRMQEAFTLGTISGTCTNVGNVHEFAVGYATIDVVGNCSTGNPADAEYFSNDIRYDNVLVGDYQQVSVRNHSVQVSPMVHIRAIPEGGTPASRKENPALYANRFASTFYSRYQPQGRFNSDARQPLPSRFVTRWIQGLSATTYLKIWRQSKTGRDLTCATLDDNMRLATDVVVFDENGNGEGIVQPEFCHFICFDPEPVLPSASLQSINDTDVFPMELIAGNASGWLYLNLDDPDASGSANQAWVVTTLFSGTLSGAMEAMALGNGCSQALGKSSFSYDGNVVIGPSPNGEPEP